MMNFKFTKLECNYFTKCSFFIVETALILLLMVFITYYQTSMSWLQNHK